MKNKKLEVKKRLNKILLSCIILLLSVSGLFVVSCSETTSPDIIDVSGWWFMEDPENNENFYMEIIQENKDIEILDVFGEILASGSISNSDITVINTEGDTINLVYDNGILTGNDPEGKLISLTHLSSGPPWIQLNNRNISIDGLVTDWGLESPIIDDDENDSSGNLHTEIDNFYACKDSFHICFRIDLIGDVEFPHSGYVNDRYSVRLETIDNPYSLNIWSVNNVTLRNSNTGQEIQIENAGVSDKIIECRLNISDIGNPDKLIIKAVSYYYHSEDDNGDFDIAGSGYVIF